MEILGGQIWNRSGKSEEIFEKSNRSISVLKSELWFAGNAPRSPALLWDLAASQQSKTLFGCWGALGRLELKPTALSSVPCMQMSPEYHPTLRSFSVLTALCAITLFYLWNGVAWSKTPVVGRERLLYSLDIYCLPKVRRFNLSSAFMQMLKRMVFIYNNWRGSPQGSVILFVINPSARLLLQHNQTLY